MDRKYTKSKSYSVCAIVPAFNEEGRVSHVISVLRHLFPYVLVVDDGSTDNTAYEASSCGASVLILPNNMGKAQALKVAVSYLPECKYVVLFDADLTGLEVVHVYDLLRPVVEGQADITIGLLVGGRVATHLAQTIVPHISGQRAMKSQLLVQFFKEFGDIEGYGIEEGMKRFAKKHNLRIRYVKLWGVAQVMKEEKYGLQKGIKMRMKMYRDILIALVKGIMRVLKVKGGS